MACVGVSQDSKVDCMSVSVVILSFNIPDQLEKSVRSVLEQPEISEVILIENQSTVDMADGYAMVATRCETAGVSLHFITTEDPLSFSEGQNIGIELAAHDRILLLNNDAYFLKPNSLRTSLVLLTPETPIIGHLILNADGTVGHFGATQLPGIGFCCHIGRNCNISDIVNRGVTSFSVVTGAAMLIYRTDIRFDSAYWFEFEDFDFCYQHMKRGWKILSNPHCVIVHPESTTRGPIQAVNSWWKRAQEAGYHVFRKRWKWMGVRDLPIHIRFWKWMPRDAKTLLIRFWSEVIVIPILVAVGVGWWCRSG